MSDEIDILYSRDHHGNVEFIFGGHFCSARVANMRVPSGYKGGNIKELIVCRTKFYDVRDEDVLFLYGRKPASHKRAVLVDQAPEGLIQSIVEWLEKQYPAKD